MMMMRELIVEGIHDDDLLPWGYSMNIFDEVDVYFEHSMIIHNLLPKGGHTSGNPKIRQFFDALPLNREISRQEANALGEGMKISEKSVGNYIKQFLQKGLMTNPKYGSYIKSNA